MQPERQQIQISSGRPKSSVDLPTSSRSGSIAAPAGFAKKIVHWQMSHGRHALPWQNTRDPYRVWLSEIMLQQTQVVTVIAYYSRFLERFPTVAELASASEDAVLGLWSGLGYYSRARNLHRCAQEVVALHGGKFPRTADQLQTLPGIGRSTAAAIASFCCGERVAILDANVKRVLTRVLGFSDDLAKAVNEHALWEKATQLLPNSNLPQSMPRYTQGLMDLGATICSKRQPKCLLCPVRKICTSRADGNPEKYPVKTRTLKRSKQALSLRLAQRPDGTCWLERRPVPGIWGGLFCLPAFESDDALKAFVPYALQFEVQPLKPLIHVLTHKDLHLSPWHVRLHSTHVLHCASEASISSGAWFSPSEWESLGLPAPIRKLLEQYALDC